jgi:NhaA family Na+:H+ antiporter
MGGASIVVALGAAGALTLTLVALSRGGVQRALPYALLGVALWMALLKSGLHATLAGVILGLTIPAEAPRTSGDVLDDLDAALDSLRRAVRTQGTDNTALAAIERHLESVQAPLDRFVHGLHGAVAFGVVPVFALANAGISLSGGASLTSPASMGSMLGLVIGKPVGVFGATWLAVRTGLAPKPTGATWREVLGRGDAVGHRLHHVALRRRASLRRQPARWRTARRWACWWARWSRPWRA